MKYQIMIKSYSKATENWNFFQDYSSIYTRICDMEGGVTYERFN